MTCFDVSIVGGGMAGLAAATYLARAGKRVRLLERAKQIGGRARTDENAGYHFNLGPHALFARGAGVTVLRELGVPFRGGLFAGDGHYAQYRGRLHALPTGRLSLHASRLFNVHDKLELARVLGTLPQLQVASLRGMTLTNWLDAQVRTAPVRAFLLASVRVATYTDAPDLLDASAALNQLNLALSGSVYYVDGGWRRIVDGLRDAATSAGARIETGAPVRCIDDLDGTVVIAAGPATATALLGRDFGSLVPVRAACLDVALRRLPHPRTTFAMGMDRPTYYSVHSAYAELAPAGGAVIHLARYLPPGGASESAVDRAELEALLEQLQPGWRNELVNQRFLPQVTVSNAVVTPAGRPAIDAGRALLVGDWVGQKGMLADAALSSARTAAAAILGKAENGETFAA